MRAEAGANFFSWLVGSDDDRKFLDEFSSNQKITAYLAYKEMLEWSKATDQRLQVVPALESCYEFLGGDHTTDDKSFQTTQLGINLQKWADEGSSQFWVDFPSWLGDYKPFIESLRATAAINAMMAGSPKPLDN